VTATVVRRTSRRERSRVAVVLAVALAGLALLAYVVLAHGPSTPPWVSATAADASFTARFPRPPVVGDGSAGQSTLTWSDGPDELYLATSQPIGVTDPAGEQQALDVAVGQLDHRAADSVTATSFRGRPARTYRVQSGATSTQGIFFVDGGLLFSAVTVGPQAVAHAGQFFDSIHPRH